MRSKLTPKAIQHLPPAAGKRYEVRDTLVVGLALRVSSSGRKIWNVHTRVGGRSRRFKIGQYPNITLAEAREIARDRLQNPQELSDSPSETAAPNLGTIIPQFIELYARPRNRDWRGTERVLQKFTSLNETPINEIRRGDIVRILDQIIADGAPFRANRALAAIKRVFGWCLDRGLMEFNPIVSLKPPTKERPRDRVLTLDELRSFWVSSEREGFPFEQCLKILILTGQRRGEVSGMRWSEIDLNELSWTIPGTRTKNGTTHIVPLSNTAADILRSIPRHLGSEFVFTTTGTTAVSGFGRLKRRLDQSSSPADWRLHDIRRSVATHLAAAQVAPHVIEAILNHRSGIISGVAATYNRHAYLLEKRQALAVWADKLEQITRGQLAYH